MTLTPNQINPLRSKVTKSGAHGTGDLDHQAGLDLELLGVG
jgi:hypothetical protein